MPWKDVDGNIFPNEDEAREHALENMVVSDYVIYCPLTMSQILEKIWTYYPGIWERLAEAFEDELYEVENEYFLDHYWEEDDDDEDDYETASNYSYNEVQEEYERNAGGL